MKLNQNSEKLCNLCNLTKGAQPELDLLEPRALSTLLGGRWAEDTSSMWAHCPFMDLGYLDFSFDLLASFMP